MEPANSTKDKHLFSCGNVANAGGGLSDNKIYFGDNLARSGRPSILWEVVTPGYLFPACHDKKLSVGYF
jgi:hypothetical protein